MAQETAPGPVLGTHGPITIALPSHARAELTRKMLLRHLTNASLAQKAGVSLGTISNLRNGRQITAEILGRVTAALNRIPVDPDLEKLLEGEP
jgi:transcriptional regulator with XRE-family HTH domain